MISVLSPKSQLRTIRRPLQGPPGDDFFFLKHSSQITENASVEALPVMCSCREICH